MFPSEVLGIEQPPYKMEASLSLQLPSYNRDSLCIHHPSGPDFSSSPVLEPPGTLAFPEPSILSMSIFTTSVSSA